MKELVFHRWLLPHLDRFAHRTAYVDEGDGHRATWAEHAERVFRLTSAMRRHLGVAGDDRFAILARNGHAFLELYHAAFLGAGIANPLNVRFAPAEMAFVLRDSGARVCFVDRTYAAVVDEIRDEAGLEHVVLLGEADAPHDHGYESLLLAGEPVEPPEPEEDDACLLMYTGGTTGRPKGVLCDQRAEMLNAMHLAAALAWDEDDVWLQQNPMFHAGSIFPVIAGITRGAPMVIMPSFDAGAVIDLVERHRVTVTGTVPTMIAMVLDHPAFEPSRLRSLRRLGYGASPMPLSLLKRLQRLLPDLDLFQFYGMTEASTGLTCLTAADHRKGGDLLRSAGRPLTGIRLSVRDADGTQQPRGAIGEVCAQGGNLMSGYWNCPEQTEQALRDGWYHTGDSGYIDDDGYLFLVDRVRDMIVTGGENVYSIEVENAIASHDAVAQVAVIGIPSEQWGEAVHAIVVVKPGMAVTGAEIIDHARRSIARYKVPKTVEFREEPLPLSGVMKTAKQELRAPYWEGVERPSSATSAP
jgi:long-chain acyl-CoA synthetase